jgi:hypothetical protein
MYTDVYTQIHAYAQVDHILVERLQGTWQKGLLAGARTASADLAHKLDEHDAAQKRYLGHKCAENAAGLVQIPALNRLQLRKRMLHVYSPGQHAPTAGAACISAVHAL